MSVAHQVRGLRMAKLMILLLLLLLLLIDTL